MANAILDNLQTLRGRVQAGPAGKFLRWWMEELRQVLPLSWQQKLQYAARRVTFSVQGERLEVGIDENRRLRALERFPLAQQATLQQQQLDDLLKKNDLAEAPRFLLLESASVLSRRINLPAAAEASLAQVLSFEMDRQTPFKAADVYFDWKIFERDSDSGQLRLNLFVVPRREVDQFLRPLLARGLELSGIDVVDDGTTLGLNLLPVQQRRRPANPKARLNVALGAAAALLLALVMAQSLYLRGHQVHELENAIAEVQDEARRVVRIRQQIEDASEAASFLALQRAESPLSIELLADVTRILPDDTYLDRLVIGQSSVQMQGKSQNAQRLIERVNQSELLGDAAFRGSTRLDARSGLEIFEVNAQIAPADEG